MSEEGTYRVKVFQMQMHESDNSELIPLEIPNTSPAGNYQKNSTADFNERTNVNINQNEISRKCRKTWEVIGLVLCLIAIVLDYVLSFFMIFWFERHLNESKYYSNGTLTVGLWRSCLVFKDKLATDSEEKTKCWTILDKDYPFNFSFVGAAQVFQCLGLLFLFFASAATLFKLFIYKKTDGLNHFAGFHAIWAAVWLAASALVVRAGLEKISSAKRDVDYTKDIQFGCYQSYLSAIISLIGGAILLLNKRVNSFLRKET